MISIELGREQAVRFLGERAALAFVIAGDAKLK